MVVARRRRDLAFGALFGEALCGEDAWVFSLRAVAPYGSFLFAEKSDVRVRLVGSSGGRASDARGIGRGSAR
jgi:hypothetical protein